MTFRADVKRNAFRDRPTAIRHVRAKSVEDLQVVVDRTAAAVEGAEENHRRALEELAAAQVRLDNVEKELADHE